MPFFAIGGIDADNLDGGARGRRPARVRAARDRRGARIPSAARELRELLDGAPSDVRDAAAASSTTSAARAHARRASAPPSERARAALEPLGPDERPAALLVAIGVCALLAIGVIVGALTVHDLSSHGGSLPGGAAARGDASRCSRSGMYSRRYWAVLGFEALLAFQILVTSLALVVASTLRAAGGCLRRASASAAGCSGSSCA